MTTLTRIIAEQQLTEAEELYEKSGIMGLFQRWKLRKNTKKPGLKFGNQLRKVKSGERETFASAKRKSKVLGTTFADPRLAANNKQKIRIDSVKTQAGNPMGKKTRTPGKFLKTLPPTAKKTKAKAAAVTQKKQTAPKKNVGVVKVRTAKIGKPLSSVVNRPKRTVNQTFIPKQKKPATLH